MALKDDVTFAQLETVKQVKEFLRAEVDPVKSALADVNAGIRRALAETKELNNRVVTVEMGAVKNFDRVGRLDTTVGDLKHRVESVQSSSSAAARPNKIDMSAFELTFKGFSAGDAVESRIEFMKDFVQKHFPKDKEHIACYDVRMKRGNDTNKKDTMTDEAFVQFFNEGARDRVLLVTKAKKLSEGLASRGGSKITVDHAKTDWMRQRNWAMRASETEIKKNIHSAGLTANVEFVKSSTERKILVDKMEAFVQTRADPRGVFTGEFAELALP